MSASSLCFQFPCGSVGNAAAVRLSRTASTPTSTVCVGAVPWLGGGALGIPGTFTGAPSGPQTGPERCVTGGGLGAALIGSFAPSAALAGNLTPGGGGFGIALEATGTSMGLGNAGGGGFGAPPGAALTAASAPTVGVQFDHKSEPLFPPTGASRALTATATGGRVPARPRNARRMPVMRSKSASESSCRKRHRTPHSHELPALML